jgi:hypothetical protein
MEKSKPHKNKTAQKSTKYAPTNKEKTLIEVLLNPEHRLKSVSEICAVAKCNRHVYYDAFNKPDFCKYVEHKVEQLIDKYYGQMMNASIRQAVRGNATHFKILLELKGKLASRFIFPNKNGDPQPVTRGLTDMERAVRVAYLLQVALKRKEAGEPKRS